MNNEYCSIQEGLNLFSPIYYRRFDDDGVIGQVYARLHYFFNNVFII